MEMYILRNLVMRYGAQIDLHPNQKEFLWHILDFDHTGKNFSWPSLQTIGARMGITSNAGVRKIAKGLAQKQLIRICEVPGKSNRYDYTNLMKHLQPFWEAEAKNGGHLNESNPLTKVDGLDSTPQQTLGTPLNKSLVHPLTKVDPNTVNNTVNNSLTLSAPDGATNRDLKISKNSNGKPELKFQERDLAGAKWMYEQLQNQNPNFKPPSFPRWANEIRLMREQDKRTYKQIADLWTWARNDSFWMSNILSPKKLREKWDQLWMKMNAPKSIPKNGHANGNLLNGKKVVAPWEIPWNPMNQKGLVPDAAAIA